MSAQNTPTETTTLIANEGCLSRLVRPRIESPKWVRLGHNLDLIHESVDIAIHKGFVKGHTKELDDKLNTTRVEVAREHITREEVTRITDHIDARFNRLEAKIDQLIQSKLIGA